jgi:hypothetical protein
MGIGSIDVWPTTVGNVLEGDLKLGGRGRVWPTTVGNVLEGDLKLGGRGRGKFENLNRLLNV